MINDPFEKDSRAKLEECFGCENEASREKHGHLTKNDDSTNSDLHQRKRKREFWQRPWKIEGLLAANDEENWIQAQKMGFARFEKLSPESFDSRVECGVPMPRLWEPDAMVRELLLPTIMQKIKYTETIGNSTVFTPADHAPTFLEIWDLGSGSGRDVCYLAEQIKYMQTQKGKKMSFNVKILAIDQRYRSKVNPGTSVSDREECSRFWARRGVRDLIECFDINLMERTQFVELEERIQNTLGRRDASHEGSKTVLVIYAVRFWSRKFVEAFICQKTDELASSTKTPLTIIFAISHFGKSSVNTSWNFEHPKERHNTNGSLCARTRFLSYASLFVFCYFAQEKHVLERDELSTIFRNCRTKQGSECTNKRGWQVLHDRVVVDCDHGRTLIQFVAEINL